LEEIVAFRLKRKRSIPQASCYHKGNLVPVLPFVPIYDLIVRFPLELGVFATTLNMKRAKFPNFSGTTQR
jgi:hypothetical protein